MIPTYPHVTITMRDTTSADVAFNGTSHIVNGHDADHTRGLAIDYVTYRAQPLGRPVLTTVIDGPQTWQIAVTPDGQALPPDEAASWTPTPQQEAMAREPWAPPIEAEHTVPAAAAPPTTTPPVSNPAPISPAPAYTDPGFALDETLRRAPEPRTMAQQAEHSDLWSPAAMPAQDEPLTRRQMRESFLQVQQPALPAAQGWRGALARVGIRTQPSAAERAERDDVHAVSQHWPGVRTIAVVNGKGGSNKSPSTALLAAAFARYSGAATIAWDNNETRGTLGWRTEQGKHDNTVLDLIPRAAELLVPGARAGDISHFVHHQAADKYDVLRSNPNLLASEQRITAADVDAVHNVLGRYYRLILVDSGNDESAGHWLRMVDKADQLVVPTIAKPEHAEAGALLLEALTSRGGRSAELARGAVVIVSQAREKDVNPSAAEIAQGFQEWVRQVVTIPYDRAMVENVLRYDALSPTTRRAWLAAAAAVARQL